MKKPLALAAAALLLASLTACGQSAADIERDAKFVKTCHDNGGRVYYYGFTEDILGCDLSDGP